MSEIPIRVPGVPKQAYSVQGLVRETDGTPIPQVNVQAYDQDLRSLQLLGEQRTAEDGTYSIPYDVSTLKRQGKTNADLVIKATNPDGSGLAQSSTLFHAPPKIEIDLTRGNALISALPNCTRSKAPSPR